ncbi:MAG: alanine dehydrogenase, partial [Gallionella sp.]
MKIGIPKEIKPNENRISLVPAGAAALVSAGHTVVVETGAGLGSDFSDAQYLAAGAQIGRDADAVWAISELIVKVKEPVEPEWKCIRPGQVIFTYFHFAANERLTRAHIDCGATCIAYETVELSSGELPL